MDQIEMIDLSRYTNSWPIFLPICMGRNIETMETQKQSYLSNIYKYICIYLRDKIGSDHLMLPFNHSKKLH